MSKVNMRVEFESTPVRHLAIQCPECKNWFYGYDISDSEARYKYQLQFMICSCPKCSHDFECMDVNIEECGHPEVYRGVLKKKIEVEWI